MRPSYLKQGESARLFPVLSTTSKEGRTTSIVLACLSKIDEFGAELLQTVGQRLGSRAKIETFTEIVFHDEKTNLKDRPDGLIVVNKGRSEWRALVEAKIGSVELTSEQIERYRSLAKEQGLDAVITISNQFATSPEIHPIEEVRKARSKIPVFHWSWMMILTQSDILSAQNAIADEDQAVLLNELRRFLTHESAGVKGFDRMPPEWSELNRLVSAGGTVPAKSDEAIKVIAAWHQETRDLALILTRQTQTIVTEKLSRRFASDPVARRKEDLALLRENNCICAELEIPDAAAPIEIVADIGRRTVEVGMSLRAPEDKVSSKARMNWLLRQIKSDKIGDAFVRCRWPGRSEMTQFPVADLQKDPSIIEEGKNGLQVTGFHIFIAKRLGARFTQQTNFIVDLEAVVPMFYREIGQNLVGWRKAAPKIVKDRETAKDVTVDAIENDATDESL